MIAVTCSTLSVLCSMASDAGMSRSESVFLSIGLQEIEWQGWFFYITHAAPHLAVIATDRPFFPAPGTLVHQARSDFAATASTVKFSG